MKRPYIASIATLVALFLALLASNASAWRKYDTYQCNRSCNYQYSACVADVNSLRASCHTSCTLNLIVDPELRLSCREECSADVGAALATCERVCDDCKERCYYYK